MNYHLCQYVSTEYCICILVKTVKTKLKIAPLQGGVPVQILPRTRLSLRAVLVQGAAVQGRAASRSLRSEIKDQSTDYLCLVVTHIPRPLAFANRHPSIIPECVTPNLVMTNPPSASIISRALLPLRARETRRCAWHVKLSSLPLPPVSETRETPNTSSFQ